MTPQEQKLEGLRGGYSGTFLSKSTLKSPELYDGIQAIKARTKKILLPIQYCYQYYYTARFVT